MVYLSRVILECPKGPQMVAFGSLVGALTIVTCWWLSNDCSTFLAFLGHLLLTRLVCDLDEIWPALSDTHNCGRQNFA